VRWEVGHGGSGGGGAAAAPLALLLLATLCACGGRATLRDGVADLYAGRTAAADASLARYGARVGENDRPLYLLNAALVKQLRGEYAASNRLFAEADQRVERAITMSVSREAASFLVNDQTRPYTGHPFEQPLIPYYKALNYLLLDDPAGAAVEARRLNLRLAALESSLTGSDLAREVGFLRAFAGIVYEAAGEANDALVSNRLALAAYEAAGGPPADLVAATLRLADRLGLPEVAAEIAARHPGMDPPLADAEAVVVVDAGRIPHRQSESVIVPGPEFPVRLSLPGLTGGGGGHRQVVARSATATVSAWLAVDLGAAARADLEAARGNDLARLVARLVTKEVVARKVRRDHGDVAGLLVWAVNIATEVAETRAWETLPAAIYLARLPLAAGSATVEVSVDGQMVASRSLVVEAGKFYLVKARRY